MTESGSKPSSAWAYGGAWTPRSIYAVSILTLIYTLNYVDRQVLALVLPMLKHDMQLSDTSLGLISGFVFVLFYSLLGIPIARLADRANRRNILTIGLAFWSLMTALTGLAGNVWQLAATRFLMGAGEATGVAPSQSMLSDMFSKTRRPMALAILTSGTSLSALIFFPLVGWISQHYGWRVTFMAAGIPGIALALLLFFSVKEPLRGADPVKAKIAQEKFGATLRFLGASPAFLLTVLGGGFMGISLYAGQIWNPTFLVRVHHLTPVQVGSAIGILRGMMGLGGALLGGFLADRLGRRDERWRLWLPGLACVCVLPAEFLFLLSPDLNLCLLGLGLTSMFAAMHFGPVYAVCQNVARFNMRATAASLFLLVANLVGQIVGPLAVGILNDRWAAAYGQDAIRYSLILGAVCACIGGIFMLSGAGRLARDTHRAEI